MRLAFSLLIILSLITLCKPQKTDKVIIDRFIPQPTFPSGIDALKTYLKENYRWAQGQLTVEGTVFVRFSVLEGGSISEPEILRGLCETCDKEAIRLIKAMPKWNPAIQDGKPQVGSVVLPIKFGDTNPYE